MPILVIGCAKKYICWYKMKMTLQFKINKITYKNMSVTDVHKKTNLNSQIKLWNKTIN